MSDRVVESDGERNETDTESRRAAVGFATRFVLIAVALFAAYGFPYEKHGLSQFWLDAYLGGYAKLVGFVLSFGEDGVVVQGTQVFGKGSLEIVRSCDAMEINILLSSAILAFPGALGRKLLALLAGLVAVATLNVVRIVSLYYVLIGRKGAFELLHLEIWPLVMVVAAAAFFVAITKHVRGPEPHSPKVAP